MILLDTSVLSAVLRRRQTGLERAVAQRLERLLESGERLAVPGVVLQELLSGVRETRRFEELKRVLLRGYPILAASVGDHLMAAEVLGRCRRAGVAVSSVAALIAALAINARARLFAIDEDYERIAKAVSLRLLPVD